MIATHLVASALVVPMSRDVSAIVVCRTIMVSGVSKAAHLACATRWAPCLQNAMPQPDNANVSQTASAAHAENANVASFSFLCAIDVNATVSRRLAETATVSAKTASRTLQATTVSAAKTDSSVIL